MKHLIIFILAYKLIGCNNSPKSISAIELNDSAIVITKRITDTSNFKQAIVLLDHAIEQDSTIFDLYKNKFFFEISLGYYKSASKTNSRLIAFRPDSADLYFQAAIFEQFFEDSISAQKSFNSAAILFKQTLDSMDSDRAEYFYYWRLWACSMIMTGQELVIHDFLKTNCTSAIDSAIYQPEILSKTKQELKDIFRNHLKNQQIL